MKNTVAILLLSLTSCTPPSGWAAAAGATVVADEVSTAYVSDWGRWDGRARETNPYLGPAPSMPELALDGAFKLGAIYLADRLLPAWARPLAAMPVMMLECWATMTNVDRGVVPGAVSAH